MATTEITITWNPMFGQGDSASVTFHMEISDILDNQIMNKIYEHTNLYSGLFWNEIKDMLPANRTHTALSVGDFIQIANRKYVVADFGFHMIDATAKVGC